MITFQSEEDAETALKIADSPRIASLLMDATKDSQGSNGGGTEDLLCSDASQEK